MKYLIETNDCQLFLNEFTLLSVLDNYGLNERYLCQKIYLISFTALLKNQRVRIKYTIQTM